MTVHWLEEGYLRPHWITHEIGGVNGGSRLMDLGMDRIREAVDILVCIGPTAVPEAALSLRERVDELVHLGEPIVVLDLTRVGTVEAGFVGELLSCRSRIADASGVLKLVVDPERRDAFHRAGFDAAL